jgi:hypothetical protein
MQRGLHLIDGEPYVAVNDIVAWLQASAERLTQYRLVADRASRRAGLRQEAQDLLIISEQCNGGSKALAHAIVILTQWANNAEVESGCDESCDIKEDPKDPEAFDPRDDQSPGSKGP